MQALPLLLGFLPVLLFLAGLVLMDSFKLVSRGLVARSLGAGCVSAALAFCFNGWALGVIGMQPGLLRGLVAPAVEEALKAALVIYLIGRARVGFMVDAAIHGFAVGTGFALVENVYYALALRDLSPWLWIFRGLGTAVMHGSATALVAIVSKRLTDRAGSSAPILFIPGLAIAIGLHSGFNALAPFPLVATFAPLLVMPLLLVLVFELSERATRDWLGRGFDHDVEILELIESGEIRRTPTGRYLELLRGRFPGTVVADLLCMLQIHLELAARAKGMILAGKAGIEIRPAPDVRAKINELRFLQHAVGPTGRLAARPLLQTSRRDLWQIYMLGRGA